MEPRDQTCLLHLERPMHTLARTYTHSHTHTRYYATRGRMEKERKREPGLIIDDKQSCSRPSNTPLGFCSC